MSHAAKRFLELHEPAVHATKFADDLLVMFSDGLSMVLIHVPLFEAEDFADDLQKLVDEATGDAL